MTQANFTTVSSTVKAFENIGSLPGSFTTENSQKV